MVADQLVQAGMLGLLNLAHTHLLTPKDVYVVEGRLLARMQEIAYAIRTRRKHKAAAGAVAASLSRL